MTDDLFRRNANLSFDKICAAEGLVFTNEERQALRGLDHELFERLSTRIDMGIKRSTEFVDFGDSLPSLGMSGGMGRSDGNSNKGEG